MENVVFDPNKPYSWKKDEDVVLRGEEFGTLLNALRAVIGTPLAQSLFVCQNAAEVAQNVLQRMVVNGQAVEFQKSEENGNS